MEHAMCVFFFFHSYFLFLSFESMGAYKWITFDHEYKVTIDPTDVFFFVLIFLNFISFSDDILRTLEPKKKKKKITEKNTYSTK